MNDHTNNTDCRDVFMPFIEKNFTQWKPWTADCVGSHLDKFFTPRSGTVHGFAGSEYLPADFVYCTAENYIERIRLWRRNGSLLKLEAAYPDINFTFPAGFDATAGEPVKMDYSFGGMLISEGELIYADRGIAFFLNGDYNKVIKVTVFLPCPVEVYIQEIRQSTGIREFK